jgi:hypothetical protein
VILLVPAIFAPHGLGYESVSATPESRIWEGANDYNITREGTICYVSVHSGY